MCPTPSPNKTACPNSPAIGSISECPPHLYYSKPVFTADSLGRWHHLAVTYDNTSGEVIQYFDAQEVSREISPLHQPARPITFGPCEIGNWGLPTQNHDSPIRNLNGAIDEFAIYQSVLSPTEILQQFETGKPE